MTQQPDNRRTVISRYDHGGARIYFDTEGKRDLVVDIYEPEQRREAIIVALVVAGVIDDETPK